jgi:hypothetical protein
MALKGRKAAVMATPDSHEREELPTVASSRFKITKEGIESEQSVPGEHTPKLLSSVTITICAVLAVAGPIATLGSVGGRASSTWLLAIVLVQEFVVLSVAGMAWVARKR